MEVTGNVLIIVNMVQLTRSLHFPDLVDAMVDKNLSFYQMLHKFGLLLDMFDIGT